MRHAFVTGTTGFVGRNLVEQLIAAGWKITALARDRGAAPFLQQQEVAIVEGSITDRESLFRALPADVDALFHVAGNTSFWSRDAAEQTRVNVDGTRNIVEAALTRRARKLVTTSSIAAYGFHDTPVTEETRSNALSTNINYLRTKWLGEEEVRKGVARGLDATIMNPANIIGPYDDRNWSRMIALVDRGKLPGVPPGAGSFCHVREVAAAHIAAVDRGRRGENYLLGGADATYLEMVTIIGRLTGKKTPTKPMPKLLLELVGRISGWVSAVTKREPDITSEGAALVTHNMLADSSKAERELGFKRVSLEEMLRDCYEWMRRDGRL
jgi:nucleoside-diphosphate-sugar epimerase